MLNPIKTSKTCNGNTQNLKLEPYFEHYLVTRKCPRGVLVMSTFSRYLKLKTSKLGTLFMNMMDA
jgi:hypothetical protein